MCSKIVQLNAAKVIEDTCGVLLDLNFLSVKILDLMCADLGINPQSIKTVSQYKAVNALYMAADIDPGILLKRGYLIKNLIIEASEEAFKGKDDIASLALMGVLRDLKRGLPMSEERRDQVIRLAEHANRTSRGVFESP